MTKEMYLIGQILPENPKTSNNHDSQLVSCAMCRVPCVSVPCVSVPCVNENILQRN